MGGGKPMKKKYIAAGIGLGVGAVIAWKFATRADTVTWEQAAGEIHHASNSCFVEVDGLRVHYQEFGEENKPVMLLIHGYSASNFTWKTAAPLLAEEGFRVIAVDMIGFGFSAKPGWFDYTISSQARIIERFMDRLGIGSALVVGSSYGGAVAAMLTLDYPERVEKLVLVDAVSNDEALQNPLVHLVRVPLLGELIGAFLVDSKAFVRHRMKTSLASSNYHLVTKDRINGIHRPLHAADGHNSMLISIRNWQAQRIEHDAHLITQPTLLIWGDQDIVIPPHNGRTLHRLIPDSRLIMFKDCGHVPQEEYPEDFVKVVTEFCETKTLEPAQKDNVKSISEAKESKAVS
jgi:pimeloyl-ACP methyl ester carboxylesterase